jgi:nucleotide-binding universal stress UspA family protein
MKDVVVGVDGSEASRRALDRALRLARLTRRTTRVVHAWTPPAPVVSPLGAPFLYDVQLRENALQVASSLLEQEIGAGLARVGCDAAGPVLGLLREGQPPVVLAQAAEEAAFVVLGTRAHGRVTALLGTVVPHLLHRATCPVLVVPETAVGDQPFSRVVVGFDGSPSAQAALRWALDVAGVERTRTLVLRASDERRLPSPWLARGGLSVAELREEIVACDARAGLPGVDVQLVPGNPDVVLPAAVGPEDLLVVGSRGRGGVAGMLLGSVSAYCVSNPLSTVAVVRADGQEVARAHDEGAAAHRL